MAAQMRHMRSYGVQRSPSMHACQRVRMLVEATQCMHARMLRANRPGNHDSLLRLDLLVKALRTLLRHVRPLCMVGICIWVCQFGLCPHMVATLRHFSQVPDFRTSGLSVATEKSGLMLASLWGWLLGPQIASQIAGSTPLDWHMLAR
jgi:hypothetical protein